MHTYLPLPTAASCLQGDCASPPSEQFLASLEPIQDEAVLPAAGQCMLVFVEPITVQPGAPLWLHGLALRSQQSEFSLMYSSSGFSNDVLEHDELYMTSCTLQAAAAECLRLNNAYLEGAQSSLLLWRIVSVIAGRARADMPCSFRHQGSVLSWTKLAHVCFHFAHICKLQSNVLSIRGQLFSYR
jgi:hypothetical protein